VSFQVILGVGNSAVGAETRALLEESGEFRVVEAAGSAPDLVAAVARRDPDVALVHEDLGPLPVLDLTRELGLRHPHVAVVLAVRDDTAATYSAAMEAGARGVLTLPLSLEELQARLTAAGVWARTVRRHLSAELAGLSDVRGVGGTMVAVAGAKGGAGATVLAVHLALMAAAGGTQQRVCLVDFDLQTGDVPTVLDISYRRTVTDLVEVADELTARALQETLYAHRSGLRVLLPPAEGERAEDVTGHVARQVLGAIKSRFDVVVIDCGATVTEATAVAVEMADSVALVATPDVLCLRAAKRLLRLWERLQVRKDEDVTLVLNRASRTNEVQPDLAGRVVGAPVAGVTLPAAFRKLEPSLNSGSPERFEDVPLRRAIAELGHELKIVRPQPAAGRSRRRPRGRHGRGESGQVAAETVALTFLVLTVFLAIWQCVLYGYSYQLAGHAAVEGARKAAVGSPVEPAVRRDLPQAWRDDPDDVRVAAGGGTVTVSLEVPTVIPGLVSGPLRVAAQAAAVVERTWGWT
jgi:pilus assembly protein CpaE